LHPAGSGSGVPSRYHGWIGGGILDNVAFERFISEQTVDCVTELTTGPRMAAARGASSSAARAVSKIRQLAMCGPCIMG